MNLKPQRKQIQFNYLSIRVWVFICEFVLHVLFVWPYDITGAKPEYSICVWQEPIYSHLSDKYS